jgi:hypothetical protein
MKAANYWLVLAKMQIALAHSLYHGSIHSGSNGNCNNSSFQKPIVGATRKKLKNMIVSLVDV